MYLILIIVVIVACALLGLIVLIQNPKGGGLSSNFSSQSQLMGVQKTGDFLEKGTWILAITVMVLSLAINVAVKGGSSKSDTQQFNEQVKKASQPAATTPASQAPVNLPGNTPAAPAQQKPAK